MFSLFSNLYHPPFSSYFPPFIFLFPFHTSVLFLSAPAVVLLFHFILPIPFLLRFASHFFLFFKYIYFCILSLGHSRAFFSFTFGFYFSLFCSIYLFIFYWLTSSLFPCLSVHAFVPLSLSPSFVFSFLCIFHFLSYTLIFCISLSFPAGILSWPIVLISSLYFLPISCFTMFILSLSLVSIFSSFCFLSISTFPLFYISPLPLLSYSSTPTV